MKSELVFEKIGDINTAYPYLYVYLMDGSEPRLAGGSPFLAEIEAFLAIEVTEGKELELIFFGKKQVALSAAQWREILERAESFLPEVIANEEAYEQYVAPDKYT